MQTDEKQMARIHRDLIDGYDEELEMERDDRTLAELNADLSPDAIVQDQAARRHYFRELFRLQ